MGKWHRNKKIRSKIRAMNRTKIWRWHLDRQEEVRVVARIQAAKQRDKTTAPARTASEGAA